MTKARYQVPETRVQDILLLPCIICASSDGTGGVTGEVGDFTGGEGDPDPGRSPRFSNGGAKFFDIHFPNSNKTEND